MRDSCVSVHFMLSRKQIKLNFFLKWQSFKLTQRPRSTFNMTVLFNQYYLWPNTSIWNCFIYIELNKSKDSELENGISYTVVEEQWESISALKVNKLVSPLLRKWPLNVLVHLLENSSLSKSIQHHSHPLNWQR